MQDGYCQDWKEKIIEKIEIVCFTVFKIFSTLVVSSVDKRIPGQEFLILMKLF